uniref:Variant surface glycoprotein 1125.4088 n=1 Tax=Trypanosoma brucei TaxID=5691 RepID=A0A1J0RA00_9TRYP|nr:variant surface glycoprotein 1125.4088 [Trypanosoma brucei]
MMNKKMLLTFAATLLLISRPVQSVNAGGNGNLFLDLCALVALPTRQIPDLASTTPAAADFQEILKLNATLSDEKWRKKFEKPAENKDRPKYEQVGATVDEIQKLRWEGWTKAEDDLDKEKGTKATLKKAGIDGCTTHEQKELSGLLQPIAEEAAATYLQLTTAAATDQKLTADAIKTKLLRAAYGDGVTQLTELTLETLKANNGNPTSRTQLCAADTPVSTKDKTLPAIIYCICAGDKGDGSGNFKACANDIPDAESTSANLNNAHADTAAIISKCPDGPSTELTAGEILTSLATFLGRGTAKTNKVIFGQLTSTACSGSSQSGLCVVYRTSTKSDTAALTAAEWRTQLLEAAELIAEQKRRNAEITKLTNRIADLKKQAFNLQPQLQLKKKIQQAFSQLSPKVQPISSPHKPQHKEECEAIQKAADCKKNENCKWEGGDAKDGKNCKLNMKAIEKKATKADKNGAAGATASTRCERHGTKPDCENDKTDDKQNCAWRKGKDGEDDKDTEKCRNGSFLVN